LIDIETIRFGRLSIKDESIINFPDGIIGFDRLKQFTILGIEDFLPFLIFTSMDNTSMCFPVISPFPFFPDYKPVMNEVDIVNVNAIEEMEDLQIYCFVAFVGNPRQPVINLRNPLIVDVANMTGSQISLCEGKYSPRSPIDLGEILVRSNL
jgi:flagellar assembly factor FliW